MRLEILAVTTGSGAAFWSPTSLTSCSVVRANTQPVGMQYQREKNPNMQLANIVSYSEKKHDNMQQKTKLYFKPCMKLDQHHIEPLETNYTCLYILPRLSLKRVIELVKAEMYLCIEQIM